MSDVTEVTALIKRIAADEELRNRLLAANDAERAAIIAELGFADITPAEIAAGASAFTPEMLDELDDSELENLAGGADTSTTATTVTTYVIVTSAAAAVAT